MTHYHLVGIKGAGMSSLAQIMHDLGHEVQGSDIEKYIFIEGTPKNKGTKVLPFNVDNIHEGMIATQGNAFPDTHEEIVRAYESKLDVIRYRNSFGQVINQYTSVAVTGVHGETSTAGLLSYVMNEDKKTSFLTGDGTGMGLLGNDYFTFETCEHRRHFLSYHPNYAIMTNIDHDHPDYFKNINDVASASQEMANNVRKAIIARGDDEHLRSLKADVPIYYYGLSENDDVYADNIQITENGTQFDVYINGEYYDQFLTLQYGNHNVQNALVVITISYLEKMDVNSIKEALETSGGVKRRFNETFVSKQVLVDDYVHHPREISATIETARKKYLNKDVVAVFQPHTFSRTQAFLGEFADALSKADHVFLCEIFGPICENTGESTIQDLIDCTGGSVLVDENSIDVLEKFDNVVVLFMDAGDIQKIQRVYEEKTSMSKKF